MFEGSCLGFGICVPETRNPKRVALGQAFVARPWALHLVSGDEGMRLPELGLVQLGCTEV